jgi:hypothetical protein
VQFDRSIEVLTLFDTGCSVDCISEEAFYRLPGHSKVKTEKILTRVEYGIKSSTSVPKELIKTQLLVNLQLEEYTLYLLTDMLVIPGLSEDCILGCKTLKDNGLLTLMEDPRQWTIQKLP